MTTRQQTIHQVRSTIEFASTFGHRRLPDGTELFGHVPHVGPEAWLHVWYRPLESSELKHLEQRVGPVPDVYRWWLAQSNGMYLFSGALTLDGLRSDYSRQPLVRQPFDLAVPNIHERPADADDNAFYIGGYGRDGSLLYLDAKTNRAHRCTRTSSAPLTTWGSFEEMLVSESLRLDRQFDRGRRIDRLR